MDNDKNGQTNQSQLESSKEYTSAITKIENKHNFISNINHHLSLSNLSKRKTSADTSKPRLFSFSSKNKFIKFNSSKNSSSESQTKNCFTVNNFKSNIKISLINQQNSDKTDEKLYENSNLSSNQINYKNLFALYQMYHHNDSNFKNAQMNSVLTNSEEINILKNDSDEKESYSSLFGNQYVSLNMFKDKIRTIDFVIVYDSSLHNYLLDIDKNDQDIHSTYDNVSIKQSKELFKSEINYPQCSKDSNFDLTGSNQNEAIELKEINDLKTTNSNYINSKKRYLSLCCKIFEENLVAEGLQLEYSETLFINSEDKKLGFLKIHAPWEVLCKYAEILKLKMPMKQIAASWLLIDDENFHEKEIFTAPYCKDKEYLFNIPADRRLFFSSAQRAQIVDFILKRKSFSSNPNEASLFGISKLIQDGSYIDAYPLHEGILNYKTFKKDLIEKEKKTHQNTKGFINNFFLENLHSPRIVLFNNWASLKCLFKKQPLDEIKNYFGVKIALYFAWLGFYTSMLIPASIVGLCCFLYGVFTMDNVSVTQVCNGTLDFLPMCPLCNIKDCEFWNMSETCTYVKISHLFDNPATVFFTVFMSLWATVYLEMWKRYSSRITFRWDLSTFDAFEEYPRPEYLARLSTTEKKRLNLITKMYEVYVPFWKLSMQKLLSLSVVLLLILLALASVIGVIIYRVSVRAALSQDEDLSKYSYLLTSTTAALINLVCILIFNQIYSYIAVYLTELEMPRTQTDFDNSLTLKMYLLQFVNYYSSIFYIAFFKGRFINHPGQIIDNTKFTSLTQEECGTGGCLVELAIQLAIIMVGKQALTGVLEMVQPWLEWLMKYWRLKKKNKFSNFSNLPQIESDYLLAQWLPQSLFYEYLEMVLQFGFVTIFVAAFPLAPLFALINNALEIRMDARKMITSLRRPVAQRVKNIGIWYRILDSIGKLSVITNGFVIAFTSDFIPKMYHYSKFGNFDSYLNSTLSFFNASEITHIGNKDKFFKNITQPHYCMYQGYRHPPEHIEKYESTQTNWEILALKLAFVVIFENAIATTTMFLRWLIPDVPRKLRQKMRQNAYLTNELIMQQEIKRAKQNFD